MKSKILAAVCAVALMLATGASVFADAGGGPGANNGCAGHQGLPNCGH